jgi:hypothetical protein
VRARVCVRACVLQRALKSNSISIRPYRTWEEHFWFERNSHNNPVRIILIDDDDNDDYVDDDHALGLNNLVFSEQHDFSLDSKENNKHFLKKTCKLISLKE